MNELGGSRKMDILFSAGEKVNMIVEMDLSKGASYDVLMLIKGKLESENIAVTITNGGITFSVSRLGYDIAQSILNEYKLEMTDVDHKKNDWLK